jgi:hypothetical protein
MVHTIDEMVFKRCHEIDDHPDIASITTETLEFVQDACEDIVQNLDRVGQEVVACFFFENTENCVQGVD